MIEPPEHRFAAMHQLWRDVTGQVLVPKRHHLDQWARLSIEVDADHKAMGLTMEKAIILVAGRIKRLAKNAPGWAHHLSFWRFTDVTIFRDEHLACVLQEARVPKKPAHASVLENFTGRRMEAPTREPVSAAVALERTRLAEQLSEWRRNNR